MKINRKYLLLGCLLIVGASGMFWAYHRQNKWGFLRVGEDDSRRGVYGTYYWNTDWSGTPADGDELEQAMSHESPYFGRAQRGAPHQQFSVKWRGYFEVPVSGEYTFLTKSDDGSWLWIDGTLVVDNGGKHGVQEAQGKMYLRQGVLHSIRIRYVQFGGEAFFNVFWANGNQPKTQIPADNLFPPDIQVSSVGTIVINVIEGGLVCLLALISGIVFKNAQRKRLLDIGFPLLISIVAFMVAYYFCKHWTGTPSFYQIRFAPAVSMVCGKGFYDYDLSRHEKLAAFLSMKTDTFSCQDSPDEKDRLQASTFQYMEYYLMLTVAAYWAICGISWSGLIGFASLMYACTILCVWGIFRVFLPRTLALLPTLLLMFSPLHLNNLPHLRDYSKAPFLLAIILLVSILVTKPLPSKIILSICILAGLVAGLGYGFRTDLLIAMPFAAVGLCIFLPGRISQNLKLKCTGIALLGLSFYISVYPIMNNLRGKGAMAQYIIQGQAIPFTDSLGVSSELYDAGDQYNDGLASAIFNSYGQLYWPEKVPTFVTQNYEWIGMQYLRELAKNFPGDILTRIYGASLMLLDIPFQQGNISLRNSPTWLSQIYTSMDRWKSHISQGYRIVAVLVAMLLLIIYKFRIGLFFCFVWLYFSAACSLQFSTRHIFHLEFLWFLLFFLLMNNGMNMIKKFFYRLKSRDTGTCNRIYPLYAQAMKNMFLFAGLVVLVIYLPLISARWYQDVNIKKLFQSYLNAEKQPLQYQRTLVNDQVLLIPDFQDDGDVSGKSKRPTFSEYLVLEFIANPESALAKFPVIISYETSDWFRNFTRTLIVDFSDRPYGKFTIFYPVYFYVDLTNQDHQAILGNASARNLTSTFKGVKIPSDAEALLSGIYRIKDQTAFPLRLNLYLPENWKEYTLHQTFFFENRTVRQNRS